MFYNKYHEYFEMKFDIAILELFLNWYEGVEGP